MKVIVLGLDTKINKRVTMHSAIMSFMLMKQCDNETSASCLTCFKSMVRDLTIAGGAHAFLSKTVLNKDLNYATDDEIENEKRSF